MFRFSLTRVLSTISLSLLALLLWNLYRNQASNYQRTCNATVEYQNELEALLKRTKDVLGKHNLLNFLCYGSLWGEIRMSRLFPWSETAEICVLNEQLEHIKSEDFQRSFKEDHLNIKHISREGYYIVESDNEMATIRPFVEIYVFAKDELQNVYKRIGWRRGIMPPHCDWTPSLHCFPAHLVDDLPLPQRRLGKYKYSVPKGGADLQKYHYAENWWLEIKIYNC